LFALGSYLNRSFSVNIENSKSSILHLLYGVSNDLSSVLYYSTCTPLLSVLSYLILQQTITSADDTQLFLSFSAVNLSQNITHLENTIANVSNWLSSNFLALNPSKNDFLIFGLPQQVNSLNSITLPFICLTMSFSCLLNLLIILVLSLIKICHLVNISLLFFDLVLVHC